MNVHRDFLRTALLGSLLGSGLLGCTPPADMGASSIGIPKSQEQLASQRQTATVQLTQGAGVSTVNAVNALGFRILSDAAGRKPGENVFISSPSIVMSLAMAYNGAGGETASQMSRVLGVEGVGLDKANAGFKSLYEFLESPSPDVELTIANSIWASDRVRFRTDFLDRGRQVFGAEIRTMNFADASAAANINNWVAQSTKGKIDKLIDEVPEDAVMYLINAIYFRGMWSNQFDKLLTRHGDFHLADGKIKKSPFMRNSGRYAYEKTAAYESVSIPYGDGRLSMLLVLPAQSEKLSDFLDPSNLEMFDAMVKNMKSQQGTVILPKFRSTYEATLNDTLRELGMPIAFEEHRADFSGMLREARLFISRVIHKTFVEVTEEGTEAAAATGTEISVTSAPAEDPFVFKADRPFVYAIRDSQTGLILFAGVMYSPTF